jgi:hypothetical protein
VRGRAVQRQVIVNATPLRVGDTIGGILAPFAAQPTLPTSNASFARHSTFQGHNVDGAAANRADADSVPPFKEWRGAEYKKRLEALGLRNVRIDAIGNVIAERKGVGTGPTVVIAGHLDRYSPRDGRHRQTRWRQTARAGHW